MNSKHILGLCTEVRGRFILRTCVDGVLIAGCIDTDLPTIRRTFGLSGRSFIETAHVNHAMRVMSTETRCKKLRQPYF